MSACAFEGCGIASQARGLCRGHYQMWHQGRELRPIRKMWTPSRNVRFARLYESGLPMETIAKRMAVSYDAANSHAERMGLSRPRLSRSWTPAATEKLRAMHASGMAFEDIADALGTTRAAIGDKARLLGLKRGRGKWAPNDARRGRPRLKRCRCGLLLPCESCIPDIAVYAAARRAA
jgi:hypothetical protein